MQSTVDNPANQGHLEHSNSLSDVLAHIVHKLTHEVEQKLILIGQSLSPLNQPFYPISDQLDNNEDFSTDILLQKKFTFPVDLDLTSSATRVMFNNNDLIRRQICLKMWLNCQNGIYNTGDLTQQTTFLLEGLAFNRRFSGNVYYGIVPILSKNPSKSDNLECGSLIVNPILANLSPDSPYALVMKRLKEEWRLDQQLQPGKLGNIRGMEFLALQVALMHQQLNRSLPEFGTPERIANKLNLNIEQFHNALGKRRTDRHIMAESVFSNVDMERIESAPALLRQVSKVQQHDFKKRHLKRHIKRCHGDLKATNLWICPPDDDFQTHERLVALDCVDFNPEFCNIDTLSDVAMLAVDLEMRLENAAKNRNEKFSAQQLARHFLQTYLKVIGENEAVWPMLEYYITEKAMVCAYMSIVYDNLPTLGEKYLKMVLVHSQELAKYLSHQIGKSTSKTGISEKFTRIGKRITRPLFPIAS